MRSSYTLCLVAQGGDFYPVIFSAHLFTYLFFCIPFAIAKSCFSWKQRNRGIWAMPQNQITLWCYGRKRIKTVFASLFVCLVEPVRITGRAIVDPRFSKALKPNSGLHWQLSILVRAVVRRHFLKGTDLCFLDKWEKESVTKLLNGITKVSYQRHVIKIPLKVWHGLRFLFSKSRLAYPGSTYRISLAILSSITRSAFGKSKVIMWEEGQILKILHTQNESLSSVVSEMSAYELIKDKAIAHCFTTPSILIVTSLGTYISGVYIHTRVFNRHWWAF